MTDERNPQDAWEPIVKAMLARKPKRPAEMRRRLGFLGELLRKDWLPQEGRDYLADILQEIAAGRDPASLLPPERPKERRSALDLLCAVERERVKRGATYGDMDAVYRKVAGTELAPGTVKKKASIARTGLRETFADNVAAGADPDEVIATISTWLGLSETSARLILSNPVLAG